MWNCIVNVKWREYKVTNTTAKIYGEDEGRMWLRYDIRYEI